MAVDPDRAGEEQVMTIAADLYQAGALRVLRFRPERGEDWNEQLMKEAA